MWPLCGMFALGIVLRAFAGPPPCRLGEVLQTSFRAEPSLPPWGFEVYGLYPRATLRVDQIVSFFRGAQMEGSR